MSEIGAETESDLSMSPETGNERTIETTLDNESSVSPVKASV
jgi:hypothetical protein